MKKFALLLSALVLTACGNQNSNTQTSNNENKTATGTTGETRKVELLNVSYDVARDFYKDFNPLFVEHYKSVSPNITLDIKQSHGGSSKQALSVKNGLEADVVTMNQSSDVQILADAKLVHADWQNAFPNNAIPFTSTIVFVVKEGNPKGIKDWSDLAKQGVEIVIANPKTSGNGRYAFLGAYGYGLHSFSNDKSKADNFAKSILSNVKIFENGGRAATTTFAQRGIGDVLITFENEANIIKGKFAGTQIVYPTYTINAENPVAIVSSVTAKKDTDSVAKDYLDYLYSDAGQELAVKYFLRPSNTEILAKNADKFPEMNTFFAKDVFGDWASIMQTYFSEGGVYDKLAIGSQDRVAPAESK